MKATFIRSQWLAYLGICVVLVGAFASCQRQSPPAPQQAETPSQTTSTVAATPATESQPAAAASDEIATMLKTAITGTGNDQYTAIDDLGERHKSASTVVPEL